MVAGVESAGRPLRIGLVLETTRSQSLHIRQTFELDLYPFCCSILFVSLARCSMLRHWRFFFSGSDRNPCFFVLFLSRLSDRSHPREICVAQTEAGATNGARRSKHPSEFVGLPPSRRATQFVTDVTKRPHRLCAAPPSL
jgi:hypothetical protein